VGVRFWVLAFVPSWAQDANQSREPGLLPRAGRPVANPPWFSMGSPGELAPCQLPYHT